MAHQEPTLLELADKYAKEYFMGHGDAARTRLQTAIINTEVANHTELERLKSERDAVFDKVCTALENSLGYLKGAVNTAIAKGASDAWIREKEQELSNHEAALGIVSRQPLDPA